MQFHFENYNLKNKIVAQLKVSREMCPLNKLDDFYHFKYIAITIIY